MHKRTFKLTGIACPKCGSKTIQSEYLGKEYAVTCPDCAVWATAGTHEEAIQLAISKLVSEIDPNLRGGKQSVVKSVVGSLVEMPPDYLPDEKT